MSSPGSAGPAEIPGSCVCAAATWYVTTRPLIINGANRVCGGGNNFDLKQFTIPTGIIATLESVDKYSPTRVNQARKKKKKKREKKGKTHT